MGGRACAFARSSTSVCNGGAGVVAASHFHKEVHLAFEIYRQAGLTGAGCVRDSAAWSTPLGACGYTAVQPVHAWP